MHSYAYVSGEISRASGLRACHHSVTLAFLSTSAGSSAVHFGGLGVGNRRLPFFLRQRYLTQGTILLEGREDPGGKGANLEQTSANLVREGSAIGPGGRTLALAIMIASRARMKSKLIEKGATLPSAPRYPTYRQTELRNDHHTSNP